VGGEDATVESKLPVQAIQAPMAQDFAASATKARTQLWKAPLAGAAFLLCALTVIA
jgi:hypothetical protein